jgi:hypothetical protein
MAFGTQVNINGYDMVSIIDPSLYLDVITAASGSKSYTLASGMTLKYTAGTGIGNTQPTVSVSGSTITWSGLATPAMILVFMGV